jgi:cell division septum initiation protein DivIVA
MTDILKQIEVLEKRIAELKEIAIAQKQTADNSKASGGDDGALLDECFDILQIATYHDGRYDQYMREEWQNKAQHVVDLLAKRLGRVAYEGY